MSVADGRPYLDDFGPKGGGHSLTQAHAAIETLDQKIKSQPSGIRVPIWRQSRARWAEIFRAVKMRLDASILARHRAGDDLFTGFHTIRNYADLKSKGEAAEQRLGARSAHDASVARAAKAAHAAGIARSLPRSHNGFAGRWHTTWHGGTTEMFLSVSGRTVIGTYTYKGGQITGTLSKDGRTLTGTWTQSENNGKGRLEFVLSQDGRSWIGSYAHGTNPPSSYWSGAPLTK